jgi:methionyl-tRNA formyltransferase
MEKQKIVFFGTPEFAVPSLQLFIDRKEEVLCVVTQPDRPVGRGQKLKFSPVKELALKHDIEILQPEKIRTPKFIDQFQKLSPDLAVVAAYGQMFPKNLLEIPKNGFINVHASYLPFYRGAAPINQAIIDGEKETGVTIMLVNEGMDTGDIILQEKVVIGPEETASMLHDRLSVFGAALLGKAIDMLESGGWNPVPQDNQKATYAQLFRKGDGQINWNLSAETIFNQIRGMTPWPGCFTYLNKKILKIHKAKRLNTKKESVAGQILSVSGEGIEVSTGKGTLFLIEIQLEGKKIMAAEDFVKGHKLEPGTVLGEQSYLKKT